MSVKRSGDKVIGGVAERQRQKPGGAAARGRARVPPGWGRPKVRRVRLRALTLPPPRSRQPTRTYPRFSRRIRQGIQIRTSSGERSHHWGMVHRAAAEWRGMAADWVIPPVRVVRNTASARSTVRERTENAALDGSALARTTHLRCRGGSSPGYRSSGPSCASLSRIARSTSRASRKHPTRCQGERALRCRRGRKAHKSHPSLFPVDTSLTVVYIHEQ
jgi:hypothetical protein